MNIHPKIKRSHQTQSKPKHLALRQIHVLLWLLICLSNQVIFSQKKNHIPNSVSEEVNALADYLTKDKTTQREKFEAIYLYISENFKYNHRKAKRLYGNPSPDVKKILKKKSGICIDFAETIHELSQAAGIKSQVISGTWKEFYFDINDSIYITNHAWNLVQLDGKWFIADITADLAHYIIGVRKITHLKIKWRERLSSHIKRDTVYLHTKSYFNSNNGPRYRINYHIPFWVKPLYRLSGLIPDLFKKVKLPSKKNYYRIDPNVFFLTHAPIEKKWSLLDSADIETFERDSAWMEQRIYPVYPKDSIGKTCLACDYYTDESIESKKVKIQNIIHFNPKNVYDPAIEYNEIGNLYRQKARDASDSISTMQAIDSAVTQFKIADNYFRKSHKINKKDQNFQSQKNQLKHKIAHQKYYGFYKKLSRSNKQLHQMLPVVASSCRKTSKKINYFDISNHLTEVHPNKFAENPVNADSLLSLSLTLKKQCVQQNDILDSLLIQLEEKIFSLHPHSDSCSMELSRLNKGLLTAHYFHSHLSDIYKKEVYENQHNMESLFQHKVDTAYVELIKLISQCASIEKSIHHSLEKSKSYYTQWRKSITITIKNKATLQDRLNSLNTSLLLRCDSSLSRLDSLNSELARFTDDLKFVIKKVFFVQENLSWLIKIDLKRRNYIQKIIHHNYLRNSRIIDANQRINQSDFREIERFKKNFLLSFSKKKPGQ